MTLPCDDAPALLRGSRGAHVNTQEASDDMSESHLTFPPCGNWTAVKRAWVRLG